MTQTIDQSEPMNFLLVRVSPRKEMGDHAKERKNSSNSARIEPTTSELRPPTSSSSSTAALPTALRGLKGASPG